MKSAIIVSGDGWEKRWGCKFWSLSVGINSAGQGGRVISVIFPNVERRRCISIFSSSFNGKCNCWGSFSFIGRVDDDVRLLIVKISSVSLGGMGSGQWVVPVADITSLPRRPNGLARFNSWCVKSRIDWRRLKPVDWPSPSVGVLAVETVFERGRLDSDIEEFDWRVAGNGRVCSGRNTTTVCPSIVKEIWSFQQCFIYWI